MASSIDQMSTVEQLRLMANLTVAIKQKVQDEFPGTDVVPEVTQIMDEIAGGVGEAMKATDTAQEGQENPVEVAPGVPVNPPAEGGAAQ